MQIKKIGAYTFGVLAVLLMAGGLLSVIIDNLGVRMDIGKDKAEFFVKEAGIYVTSGVEYTSLYNGTKKLSAKTKTVLVQYDNASGYLTYERDAKYANGALLRDVYYFKNDTSNVENFPIHHLVMVEGGKGLTFQYDVQKLLYSGPTKMNIPSPQYFGRQMRVEWDGLPFYSRITHTAAKGGWLTLKYNVNSTYNEYQIRLLDPPTTEFSCDFTVNSCGFSGGTAVTSLGLYNATSASSSFYSPWLSSCTECNVTFWFNSGGLTGDNAKAYYATSNGTKANERYYIEAVNTTHFQLKPEPGYDFAVGYIPVNTWNRVVIFLNYTSGTSRVYVYNSSGSAYGYVSSSGVPKSFTTASRFFAFYTGTFTDHMWFTNYSVVDTLGTGGGTPYNGRVDITGGINFTLNNPMNGTITYNGTSVMLNVTVYNMNISGGQILNGTLPEIIYNSNFTHTPVTEGWTLNTWTHDSTNGLINNTAESGSAAWTQNLNLGNKTNGYKIMLNMSMTNFTNAKIYFGTNSGTQDGDRVLLERNGNNMNVKHDGGSFSSFSVAQNAYVLINITVNLTSGNVTVNSGASSWTNVLANSHLTFNGSYIAFVPGQNMSCCDSTHNYNGWNISEVNITNIGSPFNITNGSANSTLNVSFYNSSDGLLYSTTGVANGSQVSYNWSRPTGGTYAWYATVRTINNVINVTYMYVNISGVPPATLSPGMFVNNTFETSTDSWTDMDVQVPGYIHMSPTSAVRMYSANLSLYTNATRRNGYTLLFDMQSDNSSYLRIYPASDTLAGSGPYYFLEYNSNVNKYNVKYFDGISTYQDVIIGGLDIDRRWIFNISINLTGGITSIKIYNSTGTLVTKGPFTFDNTTIIGDDYVNIQKGTITTYDKLYDFQGWLGTWTPVAAGTLLLTGITPVASSDVYKGLYFNYTINVSCSSDTAGATCGDVVAYLDPRIVSWWFNSSDTFQATNAGGFRTDLNNADWNTIYSDLINPWMTNPTGNLWQTFTDTTTGKPVLWVPWFKSDSSLSLSNLHDGNPAGSLACGTPTATCNMQVSDEQSEIFIQFAHTGTEDQINKSINAIEACAVGVTYPPLVSWNCLRNGNAIQIKDHNFAVDAESRYVEGYWICYAREDLSTGLRARCKANAQASMYKIIASSRKVNACHDSPFASTQHCAWWAGGGNQVSAFNSPLNEYMFIGYYESILRSLLATRYYTGNTSLDDVIDETAHDYLYASGYTGTSGTSMHWGRAKFTWSCPSGTGVCTIGPTYVGQPAEFDDSDAPRDWEMCQNVELADYVYNGTTVPTIINTFLRDHCNDWSSKYQASYDGSIVGTGTTTVLSNRETCAQLRSDGTCKSGNDGYKAMGWGANMMAYRKDITNWDLFMSTAFKDYQLSTQSYNGLDYGIYGQARNIRALRYAMGKNLLLVNATPVATSSSSDTSAPVISNLQYIVGGTTVTVTWDTDDVSDSKVWYGTTNNGPYPNSQTGNSLVTSHSTDVTGLTSVTTYYYKAQSCNIYGYCTNSTQGTFTTTNPVKVAGDLVSTVVGTQPFYTIDSQPHNQSCLTNLTANSSCVITWRVNATGDLLTTHTFYALASSAYSAEVQSDHLLLTIVAAVDTTPPTISSVSTPTLGCGFAGPVYTTNEGSNTTITYWRTDTPATVFTYTQASYINGLHNTLVILNNISKHATSYTFNLLACDIAGNCATNLGSQFTSIDCASPSFVLHTNYSNTNTSVVINYTTDEPANLTMNYGVSTALGTKVYNSTLSTNKTLTLTLIPGLAYYRNMTFCDASGLCNTTGPFRFSSLNISDITTTSTTDSIFFSWSSSEPSNATLEFGPTSGLGTNYTNVSYGNLRGFNVTGLVEATSYRYRLNSCNIYGVCVYTATPFAFTSDSSAPNIVGVIIRNDSDISASIRVTFNELSNLSVKYGTNASNLNLQTSTFVFSTIQTLILSGLSPNRTYYVNLTSYCDTASNCGRNGTYNFTTKPATSILTGNNLKQDGVTGPRNYEDGTTMNLSVYYVNGTFNIVFNSTDLSYSNSSPAESSPQFLYVPIENYFDKKIGGLTTRTLNGSSNLSITYPSWFRIYGIRFNITGTNNSGARDVGVLANGILQKKLVGKLIPPYLIQDNFTGGAPTTSLFFTSATQPQYFTVNISTQELVNLSFNLEGRPSDPTPLNFTDYFINGTYINASTTTPQNVLNNETYIYVDDYQTNLFETTALGGADNNGYDDVNDDSYDLNTYSTADCNPNTQSCSISSSESGYSAFTHFDVNDYDIIGLNYSCNVNAFGTNHNNFLSSGTGNAAYSIAITPDYTTLPSTVTVYSYSISHSGSCSPSRLDWQPCSDTTTEVIYLKRVSPGSTSWYVVKGNSLYNTITIPTGTQHLILSIAASSTSRYQGEGAAGATCDVYDLILGGFGPTHSANNTHGPDFTVISDRIFNPLNNNITGALLTAGEYGTNAASRIIYYMSPNNGTNWEQVDNGLYHFFQNAGNELRWKAVGNGSVNASFGTTRVNVQVITSTPGNISMVIDGRDEILYNFSDQLNTTTGVNLTNVSILNTHIQSNCGDTDNCVVRFRVMSNATGGLLLRNLSVYSNLNPITLRNTSFPVNTSLKLDTNVTNVSIGDIRTYINGDLDNVTYAVTYQFNNGTNYTINENVNVRFSPYNITAVHPNLDFYPTTRSSKNVSAYGQNFSKPYWNITPVSTNHSTLFYVNTYEPLSACLDLRSSIYPRQEIFVDMSENGSLIANVSRILTPLEDTSGNLYTLTNLNNAVYNTTGQWYDFNATTQQLSTPASTPTGNVTFTVGAWVMTKTDRDTGFAYRFTGGAYAGGFGIGFRSATDKFTYEVRNVGDTSTFLLSSTVPALNSWHYITLVENGTHMLAYVDGVLENSTAKTITSFPYNGSVAIGRVNGGAATWAVNGSVDSVVFYNISLNSSDVLALYRNSTYVKPQNLVARYPFTNTTSGGNFGIWEYLDLNACTQVRPVNVIINTLCTDCARTFDYDEFDNQTYNP